VVPCSTFYQVHHAGKRPENALYRLTDDPECLRNLAHDPAFASVMSELRDRMIKMLLADKDPRALGNGAIFDTYKYLGARNKGYETWLQAQTFTPAPPRERAKKKAKGE